MGRFKTSIFFIVISVSVFLIVSVLCGIVLDELIVPKDYIFYDHIPLVNVLGPILLFIPGLLGSLIVISFSYEKNGVKTEEAVELSKFVTKLKKYIPIGVIVWLALLYLAMTCVTYVTETQIVILSPFDLQGKKYSYDQVERIETGYGDRRLALLEYKQRGNFYYKIILDGKAYIFEMPSVNEKYYENEETFEEIEGFDRELVKLGIPKVSDTENIEYFDYEESIKERTLRIINNK